MFGTAHERDDERYESIKRIIGTRYQRPVMIADLDARAGYFSFRLARDLDALCIMLTREKSTSDTPGSNDPAPCPTLTHKSALEQLCLFNTHLRKIVLLGAEPDSTTLLRLGTCEHFDVVLARDFLYDPSMTLEQWRAIADAIMSIGETIIIELSPAVISGLMHGAIVDYIIKNKGERIDTIGSAEKPDSIFYVISRPKTTVADCCLKSKLKKSPPHTIASTRYTKTFLKEGIERPWYPGINIMTFRALNGLFPSDDIIFDRFETEIPYAQKSSSLLIQGRDLAVLP